MYCTLDDLKKQIPETKLIQVTDDDDTGEINLANVDEAIEMAQAEIDSYAASQYPTPFSPVPKIITKYAVDIALYNLFSRRGFDSSGESSDRIILTRYKDAVKFLENLSKGVVSIGSPAAGSTPQPELPSIQNQPRIFNRKTMKGY